MPSDGTQLTAIAEVAEHLDVLARRHADSPQNHLSALYHLALEREQIAAVSYAEDVLAQRIDALDVPDGAREITRSALRWIWKEEQMHALYIRGALLKVAQPIERALAFFNQMAGAVGGWATTVLHHGHWSAAPISHCIAWSITQLAALVGKLPRSMQDDLRYVGFVEYCGYAMSAEATAELCWQRIATTAEGLVELGLADTTIAAAFRRIAVDEMRHGRVFGVLKDAFDEEGRLSPGWSTDRLRSEIGQVGDFFLPRHQRDDAATNALGSGGVVAVAHDGVDGSETLLQALADGGLNEALRSRARETNQELSSLSVAIKVTFMLGYSDRDPSSITDPKLVRDLCRYLNRLGIKNVYLLDARNLYDWYFDGRDVVSVASYFGYDFPEATVVDGGADMVAHRYGRSDAHHSVPKCWRDADFRISFGKLRSHPVEQVYLSLAHLEGMTARCEEFVFVDRQANTGQALMALLADFPPDFAVLDAFDHTPDGLLGMLACPDPPSPKRVYAGRDALSVDITAARHMGLDNLDDSQFLGTAIDWYGDPSHRVSVVGCDDKITGWRSPCHNDVSALLSLVSFPTYSLLSGRGSLFVPAMDEAAFPPRGKVSWVLGKARRFLRWLLRAVPPPAT